MELFISQFHFLRAEWFYALLPLLVITLLMLKVQKQSHSWEKIIDPKLLPHLLVGKSVKKSSFGSLLLFIVGTITIVSLAGPVWEKRPQPVFKDKSALVIALDLSTSMDAADIKPSRLTRARHKITDILKQRKLGQTALLVYAADSFVVTPLTDDTATITSLLASLTTDIMPTQGTRTDKALTLAASLLKNADIRTGDILLVTDSIESQATKTFTRVAKQHRISILAVATPQGAPIPLPAGGFLKDRSGNIIVPKLDLANFRKFSNIGQGRLSTLTADDTDIKRLNGLFNQKNINRNENSSATTLKTDSWYEHGPWLLLFIIPLAAFAFRRGIIFIFALVLIQQPQTVEANELWDSLWQTADQRASQKLEKNKTAEAAKLFNNKQWKAAALYKNKQYQESIEALKGINTADSYYNKGNAHAKLGETDHAIEEYNKSIKLDAKHEDAIFNKKTLEEQQKKEQNQKSKDNKDNDKKEKSDKDKKTKSDENDKSNSTNNKEAEDKKKKDQKDQKNQSEKEKESKESKESKEEDQNEEKKQQQEKKNAEKMKEQQATKQWLRRIPDDPGGLLRNKFKYQYKRQQGQQSEKNNW